MPGFGRIEHPADDGDRLGRTHANGFIKIDPAMNWLAAPLCHPVSVCGKPALLPQIVENVLMGRLETLIKQEFQPRRTAQVDF